MERFEPGMFTDRVLGSVRVLRREIMPVFSRRVSEMIRVSIELYANVLLEILMYTKFRMRKTSRTLTRMTSLMRVGWCMME